MRTKIPRNIFISPSLLFALPQVLAGGTVDGVPNFNDNGLLHPQPTFITFDVPGAANGTSPVGINPAGVIAGITSTQTS